MYFRYCVTAKNLLDRNNIPYQSIELDKNKGEYIINNLDKCLNSSNIDTPHILPSLLYVTKQNTVPNIFIGNTHIGGYDSLSFLMKNEPNKFNSMIEKAKSMIKE